jgi:hypothetical protein
MNWRVKLSVWLGNAQHHPWLRKSSQPSATKIMLTLFWNMEGAILVHFTPKGEIVKSQNYCDVLQTKLKLTIRSKKIFIWWSYWHDAKLVKDTTKKLFFWQNLKACKIMEPVHWSWEGLHWKVILVLFLYIHKKCASFEKSLYFLTYPHTNPRTSSTYANFLYMVASRSSRTEENTVILWQVHLFDIMHISHTLYCILPGTMDSLSHVPLYCLHCEDIKN